LPGGADALARSRQGTAWRGAGAGHKDALIEVYDWLEKRVGEVVAGGVDRAKILIDPGLGFGKTLADNLALLNGLALFHGLGCPIVLGASRKRMVGALSNEAPADARLGGSLAMALKGAETRRADGPRS
jgi:dihydropteroate synthase